MSVRSRHGPIPHGLPRQRKGTTPQMVGRYPDYDVLAQTDHWDEVTRRVVLDRVENVPPIRFFTAEEAATLKAFCDVVTAQDAEPRIPVLSYIDEKLYAGRRATAGSTSTCRTTTRYGGAIARGLDDEARSRSLRLVRRRAARGPGRHRAAVLEGELHGGAWDDAERRAGVQGRDALRRAGVLLAPVGLERDRLRRPRLPARLRARSARRTSASGRRGRADEAVHVDPVPDDAQKRGMP